MSSLETNAALDMDRVRVDPAWALKIPASLALRKQVMPLCKISDEVMVACEDVEDSAALRQLERILDCPLRLLTAEPQSLRAAIKRVYGNLSSASSPTRPSGGAAQVIDSEDAVSVCEELLQAAAMRGASDIHLTPNESTLVARLRVDGKLETYSRIPNQLQGAVVSRLKVMSGLDIAEKTRAAGRAFHR